MPQSANSNAPQSSLQSLPQSSQGLPPPLPESAQVTKICDDVRSKLKDTETIMNSISRQSITTQEELNECNRLVGNALDNGHDIAREIGGLYKSAANIFLESENERRHAETPYGIATAAFKDHVESTINDKLEQREANLMNRLDTLLDERLQERLENRQSTARNDRRLFQTSPSPSRPGNHQRAGRAEKRRRTDESSNDVQIQEDELRPNLRIRTEAPGKAAFNSQTPAFNPASRSNAANLQIRSPSRESPGRTHTIPPTSKKIPPGKGEPVVNERQLLESLDVYHPTRSNQSCKATELPPNIIQAIRPTLKVLQSKAGNDPLTRNSRWKDAKWYCVNAKIAKKSNNMYQDNDFGECKGCAESNAICVQRFANRPRPVLIPVNFSHMVDEQSWMDPALWLGDFQAVEEIS